MVSPSSVRCSSDWGGMQVGGNVVLVDSAVSFHQCNLESSEREVWVPVIRKKTCDLGTSHTLLPWFKPMVSPVLVEWLGSNDEKRAGEIRKWIRGQSTPFVQLHPRISELWFPCVLFALQATRGKMEVAFERLEMWMPPTQLFCFYVRLFDEFHWGHFDVFLVSRTAAVICGGWFKIF